MVPLLLVSDDITPSFAVNFLYQNTFFAAFDTAIYSISMVESAITVCLKLFQLTVPPLQMNRLSDIDFRSSISDIKSEFVNP